jgi:hypothetical protein
MTDEQALMFLNSQLKMPITMFVQSILRSLEDDKISFFEGLMLSTQGTQMGMSLYGMFKAMDKEDVATMARVLGDARFTLDRININAAN